MSNLSTWFSLIIFNLFCFNLVQNELIFVYENARHGIRGSITENQSSIMEEGYYDIYRSQWTGNGQLTLRGKMQQYILGIRNRLKYPDLLNYANFNPDEILIHSTNTSRAKESAYNQVLGMYKPFINLPQKDNSLDKKPDSNTFYFPPNYKNWNIQSDSIYKKIINEAELSIKEYLNNKNNPNLFFAEEEFNLKINNERYKLNVDLKSYAENRTFFIIFNCPNGRQYSEYYYKKQFTELIKENLEKKYGNKLQNFFGYKKKEWLYDIRNAIIVFDNYIANYYNNRDLKEFLEETKIDKEEYFEKCLNIYKWWIYHIYCDEKTCILESQKMMEDLIGYMENKINDKNNKLKMVIDLGHDFTIAPMEIFMHEVFGTNYSITLFSSNIYFELHKQNGEYIVKYFVDDELRLYIKYELFKEKVFEKFLTEKEKDEFCNGNIYKVLYPKTFIFCSFLIIAILIGIIVFIVYKFYMKCFKKGKEKIGLKNKKKKENDDNEKELEFI